MDQAETSQSTSGHSHDKEPPVWTYPTRFCRICREDVPATVTMYPPGIPMQFQRPVVEYKNEDEYGRLIKPCKCKGSLRYIHELCLLRSRTENTRAGSKWKCHECGHKFNFKKLTLQRFLSGRVAAAVLTVCFMVVLMFFLGFIADPIINIYLDPYDTLTGREPLWDELALSNDPQGSTSSWSAHFTKGFISMGLFGFIKTVVLNPWHWMNLRVGGSMSSRTRQTGRDRSFNISWVALLIGTFAAFVFLYRWVETFIQRSLARIGNSIVDTQFPDDDDDLKPPPGWKYEPESTSTKDTTTSDTPELKKKDQSTPQHEQPLNDVSKTSESSADQGKEQDLGMSTDHEMPGDKTPAMSDSWMSIGDMTGSTTESNLLSGVQRQGWSFANL